VWTAVGLMTYYILFFIRVSTREVYLAGLTPHPSEAWMCQMARNVTMERGGFLSGCHYLLHDRDTKFSGGFDRMVASVGVKPLRLPARSPNLNAVAERWIGSAKQECLSKLILFGGRSLRYALDEYILHHQHERNHQGKDNVILFPLSADRVGESAGSIDCRERLGGLLKLYYRRAA
jgi:putative transposase